MSAKLPPVRVGDRVRIINPLHVVRVGYPKSVVDYENVVDAAALETFLRAQAPKRYARMKSAVDTREGRAIRRQLALILAQQDGFGGSERKLHTEEIPEFKDVTGTVRFVKMARTGLYYPPSSSHDWETGYAEYEPGGLNKAKMHRLLIVDVDAMTKTSHGFKPWGSHDITIERCNVEPLKP